MNNVKNARFTNPLNAKLYEVLGPDDYDAVMELYAAVQDGNFDAWFQQYEKMEGHIDRCLKLSAMSEQIVAGFDVKGTKNR